MFPLTSVSFYMISKSLHTDLNDTRELIEARYFETDL